jgi:hypothetical protein
MPLPRIAAPLLLSALFLSPATALAQDKQPEVPDVTFGQLLKDPKKYEGRLIRVEGVVKHTPPAKDGTGGAWYPLALADGNSSRVYIIAPGKPSVVKGDRVRLTGKFTQFGFRSFLRLTLNVEKVEKLPAQKRGKA